MNQDNTNWTYREFLAFVLLYAAGMNLELTAGELQFIKDKTGIADIGKIKNKLEVLSDSECIQTIESYKKIYLQTPESELKARRDLEALLNAPGAHSQFEKAAVHILEKLI